VGLVLLLGHKHGKGGVCFVALVLDPVENGQAYDLQREPLQLTTIPREEIQ
jgi:hypothetical protein